MNDTSELEPKYSASRATERLLRMLQSMSPRFPLARIDRWKAGFGVSLDDGRSLHIVIDGSWTPEEQRDWFVLFAAWLVADPESLTSEHIRLTGQSATGRERWQRSTTRAAG